MNSISIIRPDDWHLHLRDGAEMGDVLPFTSKRFGRAIVMPNLPAPVRTADQAAAYLQEILTSIPEGHDFEPLMTLYLTDATTPDQIHKAAESGIVYAVKLYPAGATTHSDSGVSDPSRLSAVFDAMSDHRLPLLVHGEVTEPDTDIFDREALFIESVLAPVVARHEGLKVVLEHITTREAVDFVLSARDGVAATITAHHLLANRNALFENGLNPHHFCKPVLKREPHRLALVAAATSGSPRFFLGTDSAPHSRSSKECDHGCAGIFTAHAAIELYTEVFDAAGALDKLEVFASVNGPAFYELPVNEDRITLNRRPWLVPDDYRFGPERIVPFRAGSSVGWSLGE